LTAQAIAHLNEALPGNPRYAARAAVDPDFDPIRDESGFPAS